MTGLIKQKEYDWKDSNLALFGSDTEKQVKKDAAATEPAWQHAGNDVGLKIWRIEKFEVKDWPKEQYGEFFSGDSYIVLNTYKENDSDELLYDVHFWIGRYSSQDEYGTAAYKTVELDTFLDDKPVQHREVQEHESSLFKSYFKTIRYLEGGADSGFNHVTPEEYVPRLFHVKASKTGVVSKQIPRKRELLSSDDIFILDAGTQIYQWNGKTCNMKEKMKACQEVIRIKGERTGKAIKDVKMDEGEDEDEEEFFNLLNDEGEVDGQENGVDQQIQQNGSTKNEKQLFRLSDSDGDLDFSLEKTGKISRSDFNSDDVFILDTSSEVIVWVGKKASNAEKKNAMTYAHNYLKKAMNPLLPIACIKEGIRSKQFDLAVTA